MTKAIEKKGFLGEPNLALWDRVARFVIAAVIAVAWYEGYIPADIATLCLVLAGALMVNGVMGRCGIYALMGFTTCPAPRRRKASK